VIGLDTNVVVRLLVGDDPAQQRIAREYLALRSSPDDPAWVDRIVAVETIWVLERSYGFSSAQIATAFEKLLDTAELAFEDHALVRRAVAAYRRGAGFADALLALAHDYVRLESCEAAPSTYTAPRETQVIAQTPVRVELRAIGCQGSIQALND
jgi:predicted nucleic-acid-binding protein